MNQAVDAVALAGSVAAADLSLWSLFLKADLIVKAVMLLLLLASFWCWAIIVEKLIRLPGCFLCYQPYADAPPVSALPGGKAARGVPSGRAADVVPGASHLGSPRSMSG